MRIITVLVFLGASLFMWAAAMPSQAATLTFPPRAMTAANVRGLWGPPRPPAVPSAPVITASGPTPISPWFSNAAS